MIKNVNKGGGVSGRKDRKEVKKERYEKVDKEKVDKKRRWEVDEKHRGKSLF